MRTRILQSRTQKSSEDNESHANEQLLQHLYNRAKMHRAHGGRQMWRDAVKGWSAAHVVTGPRQYSRWRLPSPHLDSYPAAVDTSHAPVDSDPAHTGRLEYADSDLAPIDLLAAAEVSPKDVNIQAPCTLAASAAQPPTLHQLLRHLRECKYPC